MSFLLDTDIISQGTKPSPDAAVMAWLRGQSASLLFLSVVTIAELRIGVAMQPSGRRKAGLAQWLEEEVPARFDGRILAVTNEIADDCGGLLAGTRLRGFTMDPFDALIAATARVHGYKLATLNFRHFAELDVPLVRF